MRLDGFLGDICNANAYWGEVAGNRGSWGCIPQPAGARGKPQHDYTAPISITSPPFKMQEGKAFYKILSNHYDENYKRYRICSNKKNGTIERFTSTVLIARPLFKTNTLRICILYICIYINEGRTTPLLKWSLG